MITDINTAALNAKELAEEKYEERCPICDRCGERITGEFYYDVDGDIYCEECFEDYCEEFRRNVDDYWESCAPW